MDSPDSAPDPAVPQPVAMNIPQEQRRNYMNVTFTDLPDPLWHVGLVVARATRRGPTAAAAPLAGQPPVSLLLLHNPDLRFDTELLGVQLDHELDPADWLDQWVGQRQLQVVSRKRLETVSGAVGDLIVRWSLEGAPFVGRLFCLKAGPRLALFWFRAAEADYARAADAMFLSMSTFRFLDERPGPLAEKIVWARGASPIPWRAAVPVSWVLNEEPSVNPAVGSFQTTLFAAADSTGTPPPMLGKLSFAAIAPAHVGSPEAAFELMHAALRDAGVSLVPGALESQQVGAPYTQAWLCVSRATLEGTPGEVRCRLLRHPGAWVAALTLSPPREASVVVWSRVKRTLDVVLATLEWT